MTVRNYHALRDQYNEAVTVEMLNAFGLDALESIQSLMSYAVDLEDRVASLERTQLIDAECIALLDARCEELQNELDRMNDERREWKY